MSDPDEDFGVRGQSESEGSAPGSSPPRRAETPAVDSRSTARPPHPVPLPARGEGTHSCPLCSTPSEKLASLSASITSEARPLAGTSHLNLCPHCGHVFTAADVDWHTYYSQQYDATLTDDGLDELVVTPDGKTAFRTDFDYSLFRRMVKDDLHGAARVLEFGCGRSRILSRLAKDGFRRIWACDVSEKYRARAAELIGKDRISIGELPKGPFHVIATFFVLEHDTDPLASLRALRERLSDSGTLFAMVPNWRTNLGDLACADHLHHFSAESFTHLLAAAGLEVTGLDVATPGTLAVTARRTEHVTSLGNLALVKKHREAVGPFITALKKLEALPQQLDPKRRIYLYGAGFYGALAAAFVPRVDGVYDANPRKQGLERLGHKVAAPHAISPKQHAADTLVICVNAQTAPAIAAQYGHAFHDVLTF